MNARAIVAALFMIVCGVAQACAADFKVVSKGAQSSEYEIHLLGEIVKGDLKKIQDIVIAETGNPAAGAGNFILVLSSPGGDFNEGVAIASYARESNLRTLVKKGDTCASACAFAFLGGAWTEDLVYAHRTLEVGARLLFHAPYVEIGNAQVNVQDMVREVTQVTIDLNKKFDEFEVPSAIVPLLLTNDKEHTLYDATTVEAVGLLGIRVEGFSNAGKVTRSVAQNRCVNGWRLGLKNLPSAFRENDLRSFDLLSKEAGFKLKSETGGGERKNTVRVEAVDLGEGLTGTCILDPTAACSFEQSDETCFSNWDELGFLFAVPPETKLDQVQSVLASFAAREKDLFASLPADQTPSQTAAPAMDNAAPAVNETRYVCNRKSSVSNVRSGPHPKQFPVIATLANGWPLQVVGSKANPETGHVWHQVADGGVTGFIDSDAVSSACDEEIMAAAPPASVQICNKNADTTNLRSGPNAQQFPVVKKLRNGEKVELFFATPNPVSKHLWFKIRSDSTVGYVDFENVGSC